MEMETTERTSGKKANRFTAEEVEPLGISQKEAQAFADAYAFLDISLKLPGRGLADSLIEGVLVESVESIALDLSRLADEDLAKRACRHFAKAQECAQKRVQECAQKEGRGEGREDGRSELSSLRSSYTTLFTNPLGAKMHIHEAQFLYFLENPDADAGLSPRMFVNPAALSVERIVKKAGLSRNDKSNESADHIATEMELVSRLFAEKARCREIAERGGSLDGTGPALGTERALGTEPTLESERALDAVIREFSYYHCAKWHEKFFEQLAASGVHEFFNGLGWWGQFVTKALMAL